MSSLRSLRTLDVRQIVGIVTSEALARSDILQFLEGLNVRPLDDASVYDYQRKKVESHARISRGLQVIANVMSLKLSVMLFAGAGALAFVAFAYVTAPATTSWLGLVFGCAVGAVIGGIGGLAALVVCAFILMCVDGHFRGSMWEVVSYDTHTRSDKNKVPKAVGALARTITERRPDLAVFVERFSTDPFLTVRSMREPSVAYRVAVWDEWGYRIPKP
jgi:hypothetical protein